jgi:hypothetical protein
MSDAINAMIQSAIASLKKLELSELTSFGRDKLTIRHASGGTIQFRNDGKVYYNGTEIGTSSSGLWEYDSVNDETQLITQTDIDVGGYELSTTNSGSIRIGTVADSMLFSHDGSNDHQIETTNNLKIYPSGSLLISTGGSATLNGNDILTSSWSDDVSAGGNSLSDLFGIDFHALGGTITVDSTGVVSVDLTNNWQWLIDQDFGGTTELLDVGGITMTSGYTPETSLEVATKAYVDSASSGVTNPMTANLDADDYSFTDVNTISFTDGTQNDIRTDATSGDMEIVTSDSLVVSASDTFDVTATNGIELRGDVDINENKFYLYNSGSDSTSVYVWADTTNSKVVWHVPTGWAFDYTVG